MDLNPTFDLAHLDVEYLKNTYLLGFNFTDPETNGPLGDAFFEEHLRNAVSKLYDYTNVDVLQTTYTDEPHDFRLQEYLQFVWIDLFHWPVRAVTSIKAEIYTGSPIITYPSEWVRVQVEHGQLQLLPRAGTLAQMTVGTGAPLLPVLFGALTQMPHLWKVSYTAGFETSKVPRTVVEAICKLALVEAMAVLSDTLTPPGQQSNSLGIDGLSQSRSFTLPAVQARISKYQKDLFGPYSPGEKVPLIQSIRDNYFGTLLATV